VLPMIIHSLKVRLTLLFGVLTLGLIIGFMTYLYYFSSQEILVVGILFSAALVLVYFIAHVICKPIEQLTRIAEDINNIDLNNPFVVNTNVYEFKQLAQSLSQMVRTIHEQKKSLLELNVSLEEKVNLRTAALNQVNAELISLSRHDALTGVHNRLAIDEVLKHDFLQFKRSSISYTVMLLDVDFFKSVNDKYGHTVGDEVLKTIASTLNSCMRETDFVARYGGEEFLIILPDTKEQSFILAEKLRHVVSSLTFPLGQKLTVSIGLSIVNVDDNAPEDAVRRADKALYIAKENGRNQSQMI
jgi:diguanylate cyclase